MPGSRKPAKQAARLAASPPVAVPPPGTAAGRAPRLLAALAAALNAIEGAGLPVKLAHGAALTDAGFVFRLVPPHEPGFAGDCWQVRTRMLTEFPRLAPGDDFDD